MFWGSTASTGGASNQYYVCPGSSLISPILALNIYNFELLCMNESILLNWDLVNTESSNTVFEVQQSKNGIDFETIKEIYDGNFNKYSTSIEQNNGFNYYRIKSVSDNGDDSFSKTRKLNCDNNKWNDVFVHSNIQNSTILFNFNASGGSKSIELYTLDGKILHNSLLVDEKQYVLDVSRFTEGIYFAKIKVEGKAPIVKKLYVK